MATSTKPSANVLAATAGKIYRSVGFSKASNFWLWLLCAGMMTAFAGTRLKYLDLYGTFCGSATPGGRDLASPGECLYYLMPGWYQIGIMAHLASILPASLLACIQFIPVVRRKALRLHRVIGWAAVVLSIPGTITSVMISPRAMGGGLDTISMVCLLAIMFPTALYFGCINAKRHKIAEHRAWMLRAWVYGGSIVTMRILMIIFVMIISGVGGYYYPEPCDKINYLLKSQEATLARYPDCASFFSGEDPEKHIAVLATVFTKDRVHTAAVLNLVFGTSGWTAIFLNTFFVELYLRNESKGRQVANTTKKSS
ncbi:hypothetical protein F4804DRAFT_344378 [Jackrogersella minutella]|nr:hypothetical protein F4804DRAFT_344378 [Jackrogersella minutella]